MMRNSKAKKKTKESQAPVSSAWLPRIGFLCLLLNLFVVFRYEMTRKPQIIYSVAKPDSSKVQTNVVERSAVANGEDANSKSARSDPQQPNDKDTVRLTTPYHYFMHNFKRYARIFGRFFSEGSLTSYGRIEIIFPDRILLDDGSYIVNSHNPEVELTARQQADERKAVNNDGNRNAGTVQN